MSLPPGTHTTNSTMAGTVTRTLALEILRRHGIETPTQSTLTMDETQDGTSFDAEMGVHDFYRVDYLKNWLGY